MVKSKNSKNEVKEQPIEQVLWAAADKLRKNMDAAEYKHVVLGLIFLKYISDSFYDYIINLKKARASMKVQILTIPMSIVRKMYSMYHRRHAGITFKAEPSCRRSAKI